MTCPWHGQFDVRDGQHCLNKQFRRPRYDTEIVNGQVCIRLPPA